MMRLEPLDFLWFCTISELLLVTYTLFCVIKFLERVHMKFFFNDKKSFFVRNWTYSTQNKYK